jgi:uncharacterized protein YjeT (DUF2065 family)
MTNWRSTIAVSLRKAAATLRGAPAFKPKAKPVPAKRKLLGPNQLAKMSVAEIAELVVRQGRLARFNRPVAEQADALGLTPQGWKMLVLDLSQLPEVKTVVTDWLGLEPSEPADEDEAYARMAQGSTDEVDRSADETVVEYAIREVHKNKTPKVAATATAKKLSGGQNMMLGSGTTVIDPKKLEDAIWGRFLEKTKFGAARGWDDEVSADSALQVFYTGFDDKSQALRAKLVPELVKRMKGHKTSASNVRLRFLGCHRRHRLGRQEPGLGQVWTSEGHMTTDRKTIARTLRAAANRLEGGLMLSAGMKYDPENPAHREELANKMKEKLGAAGFKLSTDRTRDPGRQYGGGGWKGKEEVWVFQHRKDPGLEVQVFTSITSGGSVRSKGADAIRVCLVVKNKAKLADPNSPDAKQYDLGSECRVHRTGDIDDIVDRTVERARDAYRRANEVERCSRCSAPLATSKAGKKFCSEVCWLKKT